MSTLVLRRTALIAAAVALSACAGSSQSAAAQSSAGAPSDADRAAGWRSLVDGSSLDAWRGYKSQKVPAGWRAEHGVVTKTGDAEDLVSREKFGNFELALDWKIAEGGNSGIFYRATEEYDHIYWSGPEYQLLDDARHPDGRNRLTAAGSAYGLYAPPAGVVKPAGEWNSTRIVVRGNHVEHWLNGQKVVDYELASPDWEAKVKASKFGQWAHYGRASSGYIGIQGDHPGLLTLRNVRVRTLP